MLEVGIKFKKETIVNEKNTALTVKSGDLEVFATPMMIALMEETASGCLSEYLEENQSSVGINISTSHVSATPVGVKVYAESEITEIDGRKVSFIVKAFDEFGLIGEGTHDRFIIDKEKFMSKVNSKIK